MTNTICARRAFAGHQHRQDFSCSIVTGDDRLLASSAGLPVPHLRLTPAVRSRCTTCCSTTSTTATPTCTTTRPPGQHPSCRPHLRCSSGELSQHQGPSGRHRQLLPTTYMPFARDVYEEGALSFHVRAHQRERTDVG
ncbi:hydantoinase B/oxoprolinase family protein [Pseudonocardia sp. MCCB 268]|nr:hydantoinase B/oxoprolinase family protein [Pseudonocardia cytotoxica]